MKRIIILVFFLGLSALGIYSAIYVINDYYYPLHYDDYIIEHAETYGLPPELVASVINVESSFDANAVSNSGAIGLMQIMPTTGEEIAKKLEYESFSKDDLFHEYTNIRIGCYYLKYLIDYFNGDLRNALASYNAGMSNVNSWLGSDKYSEDGKHLKDTPYKETNEYIERVYKNLQKYKGKF